MHVLTRHREGQACPKHFPGFWVGRDECIQQIAGSSLSVIFTSQRLQNAIKSLPSFGNVKSLVYIMQIQVRIHNRAKNWWKTSQLGQCSSHNLQINFLFLKFHSKLAEVIKCQCIPSNIIMKSVIKNSQIARYIKDMLICGIMVYSWENFNVVLEASQKAWEFFQLMNLS